MTLACVNADLQAQDRWQAIEELVSQLVKSLGLDEDSRLGISRAVRLREATSSTGLGHGTALPHASSPLFKEVVAAFGRSKRGLEFEAADKKPVHLVLLFITPQGQFQRHLSALARFSKLLQSEEKRLALMAARDEVELRRLLEPGA